MSVIYLRVGKFIGHPTLNKMDIWNYIEILSHKKQSWLFPKDNLKVRLTALTRILENGYPTIIHSLIPYYLSRYYQEVYKLKFLDDVQIKY